MTARLLLANALELVAGAGAAALLRAPLSTAYLLGLAVVGVLSAHLALVHVAVGWPVLGVLAGAGAAAALVRRPPLPRPGLLDLAGAGLLVALAVRAWPAYASRPLVDYDSWAIWGMKAKALAQLGWADPSLFASSAATPAHLDYPLLLPSLEAVAARALGSFDPRAIHLQFLLLGAAGVAALHGLLARRVPGRLLWPALLALAAAPGLNAQLLTAYADVPLALFVAAGLLAAAAWLGGGGTRALALATVFFAAAGLTKNEGLVFVAAAYLGLLLATGRWRPLALSALAVEALLAPWQLFLAVHHVHSDTLLTLHALRIHHPGIGPLALHALLDRSLALDAWPLLLPLFLAAVLAAAGSRLAVFAWAWALASFLGLTWIYVVSRTEWSNYFSYSGDRVVDSVLVGAGALAPLLAAEAASRIARR
ncbi:MAG TPA: hypothetical protein VFB42_10890 [Gaiellaceae bacterium]|nr:hypothetical protein [Gaiellaceae bacterium]